jgi:pimeloyl-ACP methyl ester carboxylesterase
MLSYHRIGTGPTLVLIHGIGSRWQMWEPVLEWLSPEHDVIALDLPGFGASPMPTSEVPPGPETLTGSVLEFLDELGIERPHVAGNSLGGWVSLELAKQDRVRSVTCLSPAGFHNAREARFQRISLAGAVRLARALQPVSRQVLSTPVGRTVFLSQLAARPWRLSADTAVEEVRDLAAAPWFDETLPAITGEPFSGGEQIQVPVTIAWGERDRLLLPRQAPRAARAIPGAVSVTLRGCGHVPTWDDPEQVARVLLEGSRER